MFNKIDLTHWKRKEIFTHYLNQQTTFSITNEIDVTELLALTKKRGYTFYPSFIFLVTQIINSHKAFRTSFNSQGVLGYWDYLDPMYTIFNKDTHLFSGIWTPTHPTFHDFHHAYLEDQKKCKQATSLFPKRPIPENIVSISLIPWTSFSGFNLNINSNPNHLLPIITAGGFIRKEHSVYLPISFQIHHAVCDGYHAGVFMNGVKELAENPAEWLT